MPLSRTQLRVLRQMLEAEAVDDIEAAEIVCDGKECWLGLDRISKRTVLGLLRFVAISPLDCGLKVERYNLNSTGRNLAQFPHCADLVMHCTLNAQEFVWNNGEIEVCKNKVLRESG